MARSRAVIGVLLAVGLVVGAGVPSGAAQPKEHRYHVRAVVPFSVTNPNDGTALRGHVYLPDTPPGKRMGTVLVLSPYWGTTQEDSDKVARADRTLPYPFDWFLEQGFAFAAVNLRGTGNSDGCVNWGGDPDKQDAYQVVEGLAKQPWSNGKIGMFGGSWEGYSQYMALALRPPHLAAIVPVSSITDYWNLITRNGAPYASSWNAWAVLTGLTATGATKLAGGEQPQTSPGHLACPEFATGLQENERTVIGVDRDAYYQERYYLDEIAKSKVPVFVTNGMQRLRVYDNGFAAGGEGHILQIEGLWERLPKGNRQMLIGPWPHDYPSPIGMKPEAQQAMFKSMLREWFGHYLGDKPARPGRFDQVIYQDDKGAMHKTANWPPAPRSRDVRIPLSGEALLPSGSKATSGSQSFQSGDQALWLVQTDPGPTQCGPTQVVYTSRPVTRKVHLAGNFVADLNVESNLPRGNLVASVFAVRGNDICNNATAREFGRAITDLRQWRYTGIGADFPVMTPTRVPLRSEPLATTLLPGERIVLVVAAQHSELTPSPYKPQLTVSTGPTGGSSLVLPVVGGKLTFASPGA